MPTVPAEDSQELARRAQCVSSLYAFGLSIVTAAAFLAFRQGFPPNYTLQLIEAVGLSVVLLFFPEAFRVLAGKKIGSLSSLNNEALLTAGLFCTTLVIGAVANGHAGLIVFAVFATFMTTFGLIPSLVSAAKTKINLAALYSFILLSIWSACFLFSSAWRGNPLFIEALATNATFLWPIDTLFHTSVANMIRTYGVPSTGLNGIPILHYHTGSHWIMAQWSNFLNISTIDTYLVIFPIVVFPLMVKSMLITAIEIMKYQNIDIKRFASRSFWLTVAAGFIAFPDYVVHHIWKIDYPFNSESFAWSMMFLFLLFAGIISFLTNKRPRELTNSKALSLVVLASIAAMAIVVVKISTAAVIVPVLLYWFVRAKLYRFWTCIVPIVIASLFSFYLFSNAVPHVGKPTVMPLGYLNYYVTKNWRPFYFIVNYAWFWLFLFSELQRNRWRTLDDFKKSYAERKTYPIEVAVLITCIGVIPGLLVTLHGDAFFFSNIQHWVCICLLTGLGIHLPTGPSIKWRILPKVAMGILILVLTVNTAVLAKNCMVFNSQIKTEILRESAALIDSDFQKKVTCLSMLQKLERMPFDSKSSTLLYVPSSKSEYWNMLECAQSPFLGPALTGLAMFDGMPDALCDCRSKTYSDFGYEDYAPRSSVYHTDTNEDLTKRAKALGFSKVIALPIRDIP